LAVAFAQGQVVPATRVVPQESTSRDIKKLPEAARPIFVSSQHALDWLKHMNKPDGRFVYGFQPALVVILEGDNFTSQAGATLALARASRYFRDGHGAAIARQAALTLLLETVLDKETSIRTTAIPPQALHRLAAHGLLVSAIHELAEPGKDLLESADQLCNYVRKQQRSDGALFVAEAKSGSDEIDAVNAGWALQGVIRSHKQRPAEWKLDMLKKAHAFYMQQWPGNRSIAVAGSHTPAYAEAFLATKEPAFKASVFAMNDWLVGLQLRENAQSSRKHWNGGFPRMQNGKPDQAPPDIWSSLAAESLADACRVAKAAGDLQRLQRYERALIQCSYFLMSLQYSPNNTVHFADKFVPRILGGFYASHQDGNLRVDYTQHSLCAMVQYLDGVVE
jgi:hypothetical protein